MRFGFTVEKALGTPWGEARAGVIHTSHGDVLTPAFVPVGTQAAIKTLAPWEAREAGYTLILSNAYHLYLRPGVDLIKDAGGLHSFMGWDGSILTDSGGFQVLSLAPFRRVLRDGVEFKSHIDGSTHFLTPERVVQIQIDLGSDIAMQLDVCPRYGCSSQEARDAAFTTVEWAKRSKEAWETDPSQDGPSTPGRALFGIVQGALDVDLRVRCAEETATLGFDGYGVGGLSIGEPREERNRILQALHLSLPRSSPRYVMGLGDPESIFDSVARGMDMFDSVLPTRNARHGSALTRHGALRLLAQGFERDFSPLEEGCPCPACRNFSRAYVRHLLKAGETLGIRLLTMHNLYFMRRFMAELRTSILQGDFFQFPRRFAGIFGGENRNFTG